MFELPNMPSRKRKHAELSPELDDHVQLHDSEKEQNVWDLFKDEYHEAIEQLPLTLHRQYALVKELDQQAKVYTAELLPTLLDYIAKRRNLLLHHNMGGTNDEPSTSLGDVGEQSNASHAMSTLEVGGTSTRPTSTGVEAPRVQKGASSHPLMTSLRSLPINTTRQMLARIARLAQELLRTSEEKVNVAQAAYDSVDRHVRMVQQSIKDQEASITLGARPGHLEPGNLSDLHVGRWMKPTRSTLSPINTDDTELGRNDPDPSLPVLCSGKNSHGKPGPLQSDDASQLAQLKITLPAQPTAQPTVSTTEETYCYCQQGSFGEMIACDNKKCPREWYHVGCVGLETNPEGLKTWYCPDCRPMRRGGYKRK